jgi:PAS domain S-box-containing protein
MLERPKNDIQGEYIFRQLIEEAPVATCLFTGRDLKIAVANDAMIGMWGKDRSVIGEPLVKAVPELADQTFVDILNEVYATGIPYTATSMPAQLKVNHVLSTYYFDFTYKPLFNETGEVYGIMDMAVDVTAQVLARRKILEAQEILRDAVELAQLGTWSVDLVGRKFDYSPRLRAWCGFTETEEITFDVLYSIIQESDRQRLQEVMASAIDPASATAFDAEYTINNKLTGQEYIIHALGRAFFNETGEAYKMTGTAQDVTRGRKLQQSLEMEVHQRTEQLQALNEELHHLNDRLLSSNEELFEANERLVHSNEELAQYAYIASHDLQEPLRKIRIFSDLLRSQENLAEDNKPIVDKINQSAERMTMLINDLLSFSRLLKSDSLVHPVDLSLIATAVINDFELTIHEKNALVELGRMPVIEAIQLQMHQLFYNLLSNALKFTYPGRRPRIRITALPITIEEAGRYIQKPPGQLNYYRISFRDNGIGFDARHAEQIFEVFRRLHGRDDYPGSGIGLALCRRIVVNHKGYIYTESQPGKGTVFHFIISDKQLRD